MEATYRRFGGLETRLIDGIFEWKRGFLGNSELKTVAPTAIGRRNSWIADQTECKNCKNSMDVVYLTAAGLAQWVVRLTAEREVAGSIPGAWPILRVLK